ncbi:MAG: response regulator [Thermoleophilia bacterium]|nr:response regulator [Thermoleophilia bacterium]
MRVLLVDDSPDILLLAGNLLRLEGFEVVEAQSGAAALAQLAGGPWDGLIIDVQMPDMSGPELVRRLSASTAHRPPVVFLTGDFDDPALAALDPAGVVAKPFDPGSLAHRIRRLLAGEDDDGHVAGGSHQAA